VYIPISMSLYPFASVARLLQRFVRAWTMQGGDLRIITAMTSTT